MNPLSEHHQLTCELYRRHLVQNGVDEMVAYSQMGVLAEVYRTVQQNKAARAKMRERYTRSLNRAIALAFTLGMFAGWLGASLPPILWG
jgi:hypothetical protein